MQCRQMLVTGRFYAGAKCCTQQTGKIHNPAADHTKDMFADRHRPRHAWGNRVGRCPSLPLSARLKSGKALFSSSSSCRTSTSRTFCSVPRSRSSCAEMLEIFLQIR